MKKIHLIITAITIMILFGCSNDDNSSTNPIATLSDAKQITSFQFLLSENPIPINVIATINEETKTIVATMPSGTDITALIPTIQMSEEATLNLEGAQDFSSPVIYMVTAQDASTVSYEVIIDVTLTQRENLIAIFNANPGNTLDWDTTTNDISTWTGVITDGGGNIIELNLSYRLLTEIPEEIGNLTNLTHLYLHGNSFSSIPNEIGNLTNLVELGLNNGSLTEVPEEIGNLTNLTYLNLQVNSLSSIPAEIVNLTNLTGLYLAGNSLSSIPNEIGNLTNLNDLFIQQNNLNTIPNEIVNLISLNQLLLNNNNLATIPAEIGNLTNLTRLNLRDNNLTSIPQAVCDLETTHGTTINIDPGVICN